MMQFGYKLYFQIFSINWVGHLTDRQLLFWYRESFLYTRVTSAKFKTAGKIDEFIDMYTKFDKKGENKFTLTLKFQWVHPTHEMLC